jgi:hypothetical protein
MLISFLPPVHKEIPHEPGHHMMLRKPAGRVVQEARKLMDAEGRRGVRDFGAEIVKAFMDDRDEDAAVAKVRKLQKQSEYDTDNFDRETMLRSGIVGWSYTDLEGKPIKVTPEGIAELDEQTAQWALECLVEMIRPSAEGDKSLADAGVSLAQGEGASTH